MFRSLLVLSLTLLLAPALAGEGDKSKQEPTEKSETPAKSADSKDKQPKSKSDSPTVYTNQDLNRMFGESTAPDKPLN